MMDSNNNLSSAGAVPSASPVLGGTVTPTNDNSNPQQGTGSAKTMSSTAIQQQQQQHTYKVPPTRKDNRKLFVGGLPSDGEP